MKTTVKTLALCGALLSASMTFGQESNYDRSLTSFRYPDQRGITQFEAFDNQTPWTGFNVRVGGAFALQFQGLDHETGTTFDTLKALGSNFNLPTANLTIDAALYDGVRLHMTTYLSSRHHNEAWVKGGYIQIDKLDFIRKDFLKGVMDDVTIKIGMDDVNYGDYHFRRTDNAKAIYNPFVGNLIMDAFTTEAGGEIYYHPGHWIFMAGMTNGKLNQSVAEPDAYKPAFLLKAGYDEQFNDALRFRLTGSLYSKAASSRQYLYGGDRTGSRFYYVMENQDASATSQAFSGRYNPGFGSEMTAIMINPFVKFKGLEFLGTFETTSGKSATETDNRTFNQYAADLVYRFGPTENLYIGAKYNIVQGTEAVTGNDVSINRIEAGAGWYMTKNVMLKAEYVNQTYDGFANTSLYYEGGFDGVMLEAVVGF